MAPHSKKPKPTNLKKLPRPPHKLAISKGSKSHAAQLPLQVEDDVPDFPRGGESSTSREERNEGNAIVRNEFNKDKLSLKKMKKEKRVHNRDKSAKDDLGSLFGDGIVGKHPKFANKITLKNVSPGMKLWGVIDEVNEKDIVVNLPGGLRGLVRACDAFDPILDDEVKGDMVSFLLSRLYHEGQLVSCIVMQVEDDGKEKGKRKIWLSLQLSLLHKNLMLDAIQEGMVLSAYMKSFEDHGCILHFGVPSFTGFMPTHNLPESSKVELFVGQLTQGVVKSVDRDRRVVHISSDPDVVSRCVTKELKGISIDLLVPGMLVNARVQSTLENGIMLSFLTYFTGTVDIFNLDKIFPGPNWEQEYDKNMKFNARVLFIDPSTRAIGLTLNPHLVSNKALASFVKIGDIFDQSKVVRIDKDSGLLLEVPTLPVPTATYVNMPDVADKEIGKLNKKFKEGSCVRVRILGYRRLEGLAIGTLKASAFEGSVFTHADVKPGMVVKGKVIAVDTFGAILQFASGMKALCPLRHMSEFERTKPSKRFQVGIELVFRVLGSKSKRITVTHKRTLVNSDQEILSSYADATDGLVTHGWITKIEKHGCFVRFYNGVQGFAPRSELGLSQGTDIGSVYHVEQGVKCRVVKCIPASHRIILSFNIKPTRSLDDETVKLGSLVSGVVEHVTHHAVVVNVNASSHMKGTITLEHLADHQGLAALFLSVMRPGYCFDQLLVLDFEGNSLVLTAKNSLVNSIDQLPADVTQVQRNSVVHGYICNIIENGCFVRFLGRLTGFSPKSKATDDRRSDLSKVFCVGQSVRSSIVDVCGETGRITVSLKQSLCCSINTSFIQEYFVLEEKIANMQISDSEDPGLRWTDEFGIRSTIEGKIHEIKDFGAVVRFEKYNDVYGFISHYQMVGTSLETNSVIRAAVLDISKIERLVDLSLKPEFLIRSNEDGSALKTLKKKRKRDADEELEVNQIVNALVEVVKENYLVLSLPEYNFTIGYASLTDYNTQKLPPKPYTPGQSVIATVMTLPAPETSGRLLLLLKSLSDGVETSSSKRAKKNSSYDVGMLIQAEITEIKPLELRVKFGSRLHGRIHITEATDGNSAESPFANYRIGQTLTARIVSKGGKAGDGKGTYGWELSIKPSLLIESSEMDGCLISEGFNCSYGQNVCGYVFKIDPEWIWLTLSRDVKARLYILDSSSEPSELTGFQKRFYVGKALSGYVVSMSREKKLVRIVPHAPADSPIALEENDSNDGFPCHLVEGSIVAGRISKILSGVGGLLIQIDQHRYGKVHFTELTDSWVSNPLSGYQEGQFVKCRVLEIKRASKGTLHIDLSLRLTSAASHGFSADTSSQRMENIADLYPNMVVQGYVKSITSKGCFIMLSRKIDAKVLLCNLSDSFVENLESEFPVGKLVIGRVLSVEPLSKRVEVSLKTSSAASGQQLDPFLLNQITLGDTIAGRVKRIESFGLFISIDNTNVVGLCHISELSDDHVGDIMTKFKVGESVKAKVLKVDKNRNRVSLGMKKSYFKDEESLEIPSQQNHDSANGADDSAILADPTMPLLHSPAYVESTQNESESHHSILAEAESRALVPPLQVQLDDLESIDNEGDVGQAVQNYTNADTDEEKNQKKVKKKAREEKELEISAAEERLLEKATPRTEEEFEKLIRGSPNSSFLWIKYMAFMLSLANVDKARSIAERALRTINIREETEKLNIWVAYFNLENEFGSPSEEAVTKIFQRALQYCNPKKVYLALLGMYERTEQHKLADELLDKMCRKFKHSCKIWLRKIQSLLKQNNDGVQSVVNRALLSLPRHKHIKFISQTALLEFKCGVPDRGRSMFEGILREYPKRTDLWSVYLDQEIRLGDMDTIRALFERAISLSLPPKKMKFLFKKYLEYEKGVGDEDRIKDVMKKAMDYVETTLA
ncbi:rRNA biogenesis protein RRP5 [Andrographis paniculata]|uniref:rRNA biogenesis protein RRP5 n=1 Tax=Andrographis paniculata TaxID=175694 RepID=UPI0021E7F1A9|nr:rRNA biogenesis protein RRP5 [Andrographis paniculata]